MVKMARVRMKKRVHGDLEAEEILESQSKAGLSIIGQQN